MTTAVLPFDPSPDIARVPDSRAARAARTDEIVADMLATTDPGRRHDLEQELIATNVEVARAIAARYQHRGVPLEDLEQVALLALTKSARRYDPATGPFLAFSVPTVRGEVRRYFRDHAWMVRPPRSVQELQYRITRAQADLVAELGRPPRAEELARHLGEPLADVREAMDGKGSFAPASLDRPAGTEHDASSLGELIPSQGGEQDPSDARVILGPVVRRLSGRDRRILGMRFVDGLTQREIAEAIGVTQMQVSRLLSRIFRDLRDQIGEVPASA